MEYLVLVIIVQDYTSSLISSILYTILHGGEMKKIEKGNMLTNTPSGGNLLYGKEEDKKTKEEYKKNNLNE